MHSTLKTKRLWSTRDSAWFPAEAFDENTAILNDGSLVAALEVLPLDMALMAREEAEAILGDGSGTGSRRSRFQWRFTWAADASTQQPFFKSFGFDTIAPRR